MNGKEMLEALKDNLVEYPNKWKAIEDYWTRKMLEQRYLKETYVFSNLKSCPKCGSKNVEHVHQDCMIGRDEFIQCRIQCNDCGFHIKKYNIWQCLENGIHWNELERNNKHRKRRRY